MHAEVLFPEINLANFNASSSAIPGSASLEMRPSLSASAADTGSPEKISVDA
jgi:hypothetical protein